jgi:hypothetical protein
MTPPTQHRQMLHLAIILILGFGGVLGVAARGSWAPASGIRVPRIFPSGEGGVNEAIISDGGEHFIEVCLSPDKKFIFLIHAAAMTQ